MEYYDKTHAALAKARNITRGMCINVLLGDWQLNIDATSWSPTLSWWQSSIKEQAHQSVTDGQQDGRSHIRAAPYGTAPA